MAAPIGLIPALPAGLVAGAQHKQPAHWLQIQHLTPQNSLAEWIYLYLCRKVFKVGALATLDAKSRDLAGFLRWSLQNYGGAIESWRPQQTADYLDYLEGQLRKPRTVNRTLATLRHFARWVADNHPQGIFDKVGMPTQDVQERGLGQIAAQKLEKIQTNRLYGAAADLVKLETGDAQRPRRNLAIFALLLHTGLRVSELCALRLDQYVGSYLYNVRRKGNRREQKVFVPTKAQRPLDDYLAHERPKDDPQGLCKVLFPGRRSGTFIDRQRVGKVLRHIANEANKQLGQNVAEDDPRLIKLHPHVLRHTFGFRHRQRCGSDAATAEALGHANLHYIALYTCPTDKEKEAIMEDL